MGKRTCNKRTKSGQIQIAATEHTIPTDTNTDLLPKIINTAAAVWIAGILLMCTYLAFCWYRIKKNVCTAIPDEFEGTKFYQCDGIASPFLFGLISPKIYVPFSIAKQDLLYVLKHEKVHQSRYDHLTKFIGYLLLAFYRFQPFVWAAYLLLCRDIELACDEKVIKELGNDCKKAYSNTLLACSVRGTTAAYLVTFGEIGVKKRVKNVLNYKKPNRKITLSAIAVFIIVTICFATDAESRDKSAPKADHSAAITKNITKWAEAFCGRDGNTIYQMADDNCRKEFFEDMDMTQGNHSFGWSSPWPWGTESTDDKPNYEIMSVSDHASVILYYAWTSDPHVTVWHQRITYDYDGKQDEFLVNSSETSILDNIHTASEFCKAYPNGGRIDDTRMDYYHGNGVGEALNRNTAADRSSVLYEPDTAAVFLLNIESDPSRVKTDLSNRNGETIVTFTFLEDNSSASVKMIQPYGTDGIWIPQTDMEFVKTMSDNK